MGSKFLARYTNIVSFDDAREASRQRRIREAAEDQRLRALSGGPIHYDLSLFAGPESRNKNREPEREVHDGAPERSPLAASKSAFSKVRAFAFPGISEKPAPELVEADAEDEPAYEPVPDARERRRRERAKARADKMFDRQFADSALADYAEDAPRAALYEGQMGSSQRRAARMQRASQATPASAKINPLGWFAGLNVSPGRLKVATALLCLVLTAVFLYTPAQHYYQSVREHDRLAAEYASIEQRNAVLGDQNTSLASNAGMEDAVRQKYGYVVSGEETAVVTGLSEGASDTHKDGVEANVLASSVKAPEEWYTPYLDALFGVS